jgi:hypothetical protein
MAAEQNGTSGALVGSFSPAFRGQCVVGLPRQWRNILGEPLAFGGWDFDTSHRLRVTRLASPRSNSTRGSVSKRLTVDRHLGTVGVEGQHPSHFGGLSRRSLVAPHDAVVDLSVDVERPI